MFELKTFETGRERDVNVVAFNEQNQSSVFAGFEIALVIMYIVSEICSGL